ncbi:hypothetical protein V8E54_011543 [Elaphomyces granulatus]|jgi:hypothetical protein
MKFLSEVAAFLSVISLCAAASGTKVSTDQGIQRQILKSAHTTTFLYADDLSGCTVLAAHWAEQGTGTGAYKTALFVHVCQDTLGDATKLQTFMQDKGKSEGTSIHDRLQTLVSSNGQPEKTFLVYKVDSKGNEVYPAGNQIMKDYIKGWNIQVTGTATYKAIGANARAEQDPYETPAVFTSG